MNAADIAAALGSIHREGRAWRCRCPLHGGRSLVLRDGDQGQLLVTCWGGCDRLAVLTELRSRGLLANRTDYRLPSVARAQVNHAVQTDWRHTAGPLAMWRASVAAPEIIKRYLASRCIVLEQCPPTQAGSGFGRLRRLVANLPSSGK
jgi:hypothetical protein